MNAHTAIDRQAVEHCDDRLRVEALAASLLCKLDAAAAKTDYEPALSDIRMHRAKVRKFLRWSKEAGEHSSALGMLGPNGISPAIDAVCRAAAFHGFNWRERRAALLRSAVIGGAA